MNINYFFKGCIVFLYSLAALLPFVPDEVNLLLIVFVGFVGITYLCGIVNIVYVNKYVINMQHIFLGCFFVSILISLFVTQINGVEISQWIRGVTPFLFLSIYFLLSPITSEVKAKFLLNAIHLSCIVWMIKILFTLGFIIFSPGQMTRLTLITPDLSLPYGMIGFACSLFNDDKRFSKIKIILCTIFLALVIGSGYRSALLIIIIPILYYIKQLEPRTIVFGGIIFLLFTFGLLISDSLILNSDSGLAYMYKKRFENIGDELSSRRYLEVEYALTNFVDSPLLGKGLGYPVPGFADHVGSQVAYIHNLWAYLLMDLGLFGFAGYLGFVVYPLIKAMWIRFRSKSPPDAVYACSVMCIMEILIFCTVEATFRQIQTNLIIAVFVALIVWSTKEEKGKMKKLLDKI
ncbi:MAG: O-antigen ligase family protein [Negativicutes bacterium]|nr:O-antigen ligase family protein [Negativicutes bacterium]